MIRATEVYKSYLQGRSPIHALVGVSLEIQKGKFAVIMGPSGSGKSTLLHLMGGLDRPTRGEILVDGRIISQMADGELTLFRRRRIGFVFQFFNLLPTLTALENVMLPLILDGRPAGSSRETARTLLESVGLGARPEHLPEELSGGEIQRVALARALVFDPPILLADEPTGNLDSRTGEEILQLIRRINREQGCTVVLVTHDRDAAALGDEFFYLKDGALEKRKS
jgi:putative ABC transport system ATP-binding protein